MKRIIFAAFLIGCLVFGAGAFAAEKSVTFGWQQTISADFAGWKLSKADKSGGPYEIVADIPYVSAQDQYTTKQVLVVPGGAVTKLYFVLEAFDKSGNGSGYTDEIPGEIDFEGPEKPITFKILVITGN